MILSKTKLLCKNNRNMLNKSKILFIDKRKILLIKRRRSGKDRTAGNKAYLL